MITRYEGYVNYFQSRKLTEHYCFFFSQENAEKWKDSLLKSLQERNIKPINHWVKARRERGEEVFILFHKLWNQKTLERYFTVCRKCFSLLLCKGFLLKKMVIPSEFFGDYPKELCVCDECKKSFLED